MERWGQDAFQAEGTAWGETQRPAGICMVRVGEVQVALCHLSTGCMWEGAGREQIEETVSS